MKEMNKHFCSLSANAEQLSHATFLSDCKHALIYQQFVAAIRVCAPLLPRRTRRTGSWARAVISPLSPRQRQPDVTTMISLVPLGSIGTNSNVSKVVIPIQATIETPQSITLVSF